MDVFDGVCILKSPGKGSEFEFRPVLLAFLEDLYRGALGVKTNDPVVVMRNARRLFGEAKMFTTLSEAAVEANDLIKSNLVRMGVFVVTVPEQV